MVDALAVIYRDDVFVGQGKDHVGQQTKVLAKALGDARALVSRKSTLEA